jgi:hypothetical protein
MGENQFANCIQSNQGQSDKQNNFLIGPLLWKHGDVIVC